LNYLLPNPNVGTYCNFLIERFQFESFFDNRTNQNFRYDKDKFFETALNLFSLTNFSLRTIEQCFSQICIVLKTIPSNFYMYPEILTFLILMKNHNQDLYLKLKYKQCEEKNIINYLFSLDPTSKFNEKDICITLEAYVAYSVNQYLSERIRNKVDFLKINYYDPSNDENVSEDKKIRCKRITHIMNNLELHSGPNLLEKLFNKIDISQRFEQ